MANDNENLPPEYDFWTYTVRLVSGACMATIYAPEEIKDGIKAISKLIDTGYYDDEDGNELMKHIVKYLSGKLTK